MPNFDLDLFRQAVQALDMGDLLKLERLLNNDPSLIKYRCRNGEWYEIGYFGGAMLLHHIAGNPIRCPIPKNIADITRLLLERGADPNSTTDNGSTPIDLLITSKQASDTGIAVTLIDLLMAAGAADRVFDNPNAVSQPLWNGGRATAEALVSRGAKIDACHAAALGRLDLLQSLLGENPDSMMLEEALAYACYQNEEEMVRYLIGRGAKGDIILPANRRASVMMSGTSLHIAAYCGNSVIVKLLLGSGAQAGLRDEQWDGAPSGWADYAGHSELATLIREHESRQKKG